MSGNSIAGSREPLVLLLPKAPPILLLDDPEPTIQPPLTDASHFEGLFASMSSATDLDEWSVHHQVIFTIIFAALLLVLACAGLAILNAEATPPVPLSLELIGLCERCSSVSAHSASARLTRIDAKTGVAGTAESNGEWVEGRTLEPAVSTGSVSSSVHENNAGAPSQTESADSIFTPRHRSHMLELIASLRRLEQSGNPTGRPYDTGSWSDLSDVQARARTPESESESEPGTALSTTVSQDDMYILLHGMVEALETWSPTRGPGAGAVVESRLRPPPACFNLGLPLAANSSYESRLSRSTSTIRTTVNRDGLRRPFTGTVEPLRIRRPNRGSGTGVMVETRPRPPTAGLDMDLPLSARASYESRVFRSTSVMNATASTVEPLRIRRPNRGPGMGAVVETTARPPSPGLKVGLSFAAGSPHESRLSRSTSVVRTTVNRASLHRPFSGTVEPLRIRRPNGRPGTEVAVGARLRSPPADLNMGLALSASLLYESGLSWSISTMGTTGSRDGRYGPLNSVVEPLRIRRPNKGSGTAAMVEARLRPPPVNSYVGPPLVAGSSYGTGIVRSSSAISGLGMERGWAGIHTRPFAHLRT
ncbi:hypothetical protein RHS01_10729 [Rhizoctonia solani]|uniref:Transmembrane protein n=1 Tax=Rhizoctonia solani TaxID=456999 RepID=A0A8H7I3D0_9AGAM|nr:hypothetical protein RHS01_10729 [Rhizoctonia solani]